MRYISEIKLTELVKNFVEDLNRTRNLQEKKSKIFALLSYFETPYCEEIERQKKKKIAETFSKQCSELKTKLSHFQTDEELSFMNANSKSRLELADENRKLQEQIRLMQSVDNCENFYTCDDPCDCTIRLYALLPVLLRLKK